MNVMKTDMKIQEIVKIWFLQCPKQKHWVILITVNQLLFATTLLRDLLRINWFATTNVHDQALSRPVLL